MRPALQPRAPSPAAPCAQPCSPVRPACSPVRPACSPACAGGALTEDEDDRDALRAATACGRWLPAPFGGGGLPIATMPVHDTQFTPPHTGIVYTPPHASDHVCVTLLPRSKGHSPASVRARTTASAPPRDALGGSEAVEGSDHTGR